MIPARHIASKAVSSAAASSSLKKMAASGVEAMTFHKNPKGLIALLVGAAAFAGAAYADYDQCVFTCATGCDALHPYDDSAFAACYTGCRIACRDEYPLVDAGIPN